MNSFSLAQILKMIKEFYIDFNDRFSEDPIEYEEEFLAYTEVCNKIREHLKINKYSKEDTLIAQSIINYMDNITPTIEKFLKLKIFW